MCVRVYTCMHAYIHTYIHTDIHTYTCVGFDTAKEEVGGFCFEVDDGQEDEVQCCFLFGVLHTYTHTTSYIQTNIHTHTHTHTHRWIDR